MDVKQAVGFLYFILIMHYHQTFYHFISLPSMATEHITVYQKKLYRRLLKVKKRRNSWQHGENVVRLNHTSSVHLFVPERQFFLFIKMNLNIFYINKYHQTINATRNMTFKRIFCEYQRNMKVFYFRWYMLRHRLYVWIFHEIIKF